MKSSNRLTLLTAILININIMIGTGLFINTAALGKLAGAFGWLSYGIVALLLLPLVLSMAELLALFPAGGFYYFAKDSLGSYLGFVSTWSYFFAKLGSATVGIHTFVTIFQQLFPQLHFVPVYILDICIIMCFVCLNMKNVVTGGKIQQYLVFSKIVPVAITFTIGLYVFSSYLVGATVSQSADVPSLHDFGSTIPLVLFSLLGFEAICALSKKIENPEKNGYRAILISYAAVAGIYIMYQALFFNAVGSVFREMVDFKSAFPALFSTVMSNPILIQYVSAFVYCLIGLSALSGAYGIFFANQWNLFAVAEQRLFTAHTYFAALNGNQMPFMCAIMQGCVCVLYLFITQGQQVILQQLAALGTTITYSISVLGLLKQTQKRMYIFLAYCGVASCSLLIAACIRNFLYNGFETLLLYCVIMAFGSLLFYKETVANKSYR